MQVVDNNYLHYYYQETLEMTSETRAELLFRKHGGVLRTSDALKAGINPATFYRMVRSGRLDKLTRGVYQIADTPPLSHPDLVAVQRRVPDGVICLISALSFHDLTDQIPRDVYVALNSSARRPRLAYPPTRFFWFGGLSHEIGIDKHDLDGTEIRMYSPAKTIADCFKFRGRIGVDVAVEALRMYLDRPDRDLSKLVEYAEVCRVLEVMRPYLEALL